MSNYGTRKFLAGLSLIPVLTACGGGSEHAGHHMPPSSPGDQSAMQGMNMGDPSAVPADKIAGANLRTARMTLLETRPPGLDNAAGTAWLAIHPHGTTVTVRMTGLMPGEKYLAHLHALPCSQKHGGDHFRFDSSGPAMPPNEVHLAFTADASGQGFMTVNNDRAANDAKSLVVHPAEATDNRVSCADF